MAAKRDETSGLVPIKPNRGEATETATDAKPFRIKGGGRQELEGAAAECQ